MNFIENKVEGQIWQLKRDDGQEAIMVLFSAKVAVVLPKGAWPLQCSQWSIAIILLGLLFA